MPLEGGNGASLQTSAWTGMAVPMTPAEVEQRGEKWIGIRAIGHKRAHTQTLKLHCPIREEERR